jgi:hypothetical protein
MAKSDSGAGLKAVLDKHGYGFQYAVLKQCKDLYDHDEDSPWAPQVAELPVETEQDATHLDFVLRTSEAFLVAECKRVDPALASWGFVRAPFTRASSRRYDIKRPKVDQIAIDGSTSKIFAKPGTIAGGEPFHVGKEIKTDAKGDGTATGRSAIDDTIAQIFRGRSGFIEYLGTHQGVLGMNKPAVIIPVIFTTAQIVTSPVDLGSANISDGKLAHVPTETPRWIWYDYNVPWSMRPKVQMRVDRPDESLSRLLDVYHARSVAIVTVDGIEEFLIKAAHVVTSFDSF